MNLLDTCYLVKLHTGGSKLHILGELGGGINLNHAEESLVNDWGEVMKAIASLPPHTRPQQSNG